MDILEQSYKLYEELRDLVLDTLVRVPQDDEAAVRKAVDAGSMAYLAMVIMEDRSLDDRERQLFNRLFDKDFTLDEFSKHLMSIRNDARKAVEKPPAYFRMIAEGFDRPLRQRTSRILAEYLETLGLLAVACDERQLETEVRMVTRYRMMLDGYLDKLGVELLEPEEVKLPVEMPSLETIPVAKPVLRTDVESEDIEPVIPPK